MIGVVVSAVLHGLCLLQAFFYYQSALIARVRNSRLSFMWIDLGFYTTLRLQEG